jgi:hypothetical protein
MIPTGRLMRFNDGWRESSGAVTAYVPKNVADFLLERGAN